MFRYADDFVIACRRGRAGEVRERTQRWLETRGLKLNEAKTRVLDIHQEGINFLGFNLTWRQSRKAGSTYTLNRVRGVGLRCGTICEGS